MVAKLPLTFRVRQQGYRTMYVATVTDEEDIYLLERPGMPEDHRRVGKLRIVPAGKGKQDGKGYTMPVMMGRKGSTGEAFWTPARPIALDGVLVEAVSVSRAATKDGSNVFSLQLSYDTSNRTGSTHLLPKSAARQLHAQLDRYFGRNHFG